MSRQVTIFQVDAFTQRLFAGNPAGVVLGAVGGHGVATALAVAGGAALSKVVSERTVQYVGGSLFLVFAAATVVDIFRGV